jgi:hypothetical protein
MRSGPVNPGFPPGQLSTSVVVVSWPPFSIPVMTIGSRFALAAYMDAVKPAGPDPRIIREWCLAVLILEAL